MNILFVSTDVVPNLTPTNGDAQRTIMLLKACAMVGQVDLVTFAGEAGANIHNVNVVYAGRVPHGAPAGTRWAKWAPLLGGVEHLFGHNADREKVLDAIIANGNYDVIVARYFFRSAPCGLLKYKERLVVDFDDDLQFYFLNQLKPTSTASQRLRMRLAALKVRAQLPHTIRHLRGALFAESRTAARMGGLYLPNIPYYADTCPECNFSLPYRRLLFVGHLDYAPNREGLSHFLDNVYMPLTRTVANLEFHIVGQLSNAALQHRWQAYPGVSVAGFVDNLKTEYEQCHVVVAPVYRCGGTNIKLLEAMQMNRACATTAAALAHLQPTFVDNHDIIGASSDHDYINALTHLLNNPAHNSTIARNGHAKMQQYHTFEAFANIVSQALNN